MFAGGVNAAASGNESTDLRHATTTFSTAASEANDLDALVFEYGTAKCKFGFAGEDTPRVFERALSLQARTEIEHAKAAYQAACLESSPETVAQWMLEKANTTLQTKLNEHPLLLVERPFSLPEEFTYKEIVPNIETTDTRTKSGANTASVLNKTDVHTPGTDMSGLDQNALSRNKKRNLQAREQWTEVLMEQMDIPALFCAKSSVLACYANARTSGLVVEMGATYTSVTSVHEGYAFPHPKSVMSMYGGYDLDAYLRAKLASQVINNEEVTRQPYIWSYAIEAKESGLCRVADGAFDEAQNAQLPRINYELPDKTVISLGTERFTVAEQYFSSNTNQSETAIPTHISSASGETNDNMGRTVGISLPNLICDAGAMTTEAEIRKELFQNIVLTGGSSWFESMPLRLEREVVATLGSYQVPMSSSTPGAGGNGNPSSYQYLGGLGNMRVKVVASHPQERAIGSFLGGSILASLGSFHEMWMSKAEYAEHGVALVHKKCP